MGIYSLVFVSGMGILQGMMQELAEANGRKAYPELQLIIKQSIIIVLCLSGGAAWLFTHAEPLFNILRADEEIRALIQPCLVLMALTIPGYFLLRILFIYTQTCGQAKRVFYANTLYLIIKALYTTKKDNSLK
ncbi:MATE family efflux transporter [Acinetobacter sp. YH12049]|uniref:MATE family efflux transporter n=1 Tax=Acinetobacter sp. YH12049 TaxID=2601054 RepID=UPI00211E8A2B|nr:MATE family efflux transporter [Acinetobacter sp. YH12049]